jgi:predicted ATPase
MVAELSARNALPKEVVDRVTERTGGVPLFVEELTRLLLERGDHGGIQTIPPTLQQSLMSRLDRLGPAREVALVASVIGRDFTYSLLRTLAGMEDTDLQASLDRLAEADILLVQGLPPESEYRFKHALIQDAAYENLLKSRRHVLHRRIAEVLRDQFGEIGATEPELLAHHFTQAGLTEAAIEWWGKAGLRSLERSALVEAKEQLTRALTQIATLPSTPGLRREAINFQIALMKAVMQVEGYAAPQFKAATERARVLIEDAEARGEAPEDPLLLFSVLYSFWLASTVAFNRDVSLNLAAQYLALAEKQNATIPLMIGHRLKGLSLVYSGDITEGRAHFDQSLALFNPVQHRPMAAVLGHDARVAVLCLRSRALWMLGFPDAALADADQAITDAREIGQAPILMFALCNLAQTRSLCRTDDVANAYCDELIALAEEKGAAMWKALGCLCKGWLLGVNGKASDAVKMINSGIAAHRATGSTNWLPFYLSFLGVAYAQLHQFTDARCCIDEAMAAVETTKERWCEAEVHRLAGEIGLKAPQGDLAKAEASFERALAVARQQQAKSWELRAAMSMVRLWRDQGRREEARGLLAPVYGWFTEGFDTLDLKEAKALIDELSS